jgi:hypothetical protein
MIVRSNIIPTICEGQFSEQVVAAMDAIKDHKDKVHLIAGLLVDFYELGHIEGLKEAAERISNVIKFGAKRTQ